MTEAKKAPAKKTAPKAEKKSGKTVTVTQIASPAGRLPVQRQTLIGLGLNKISKSVEVTATPEVLGMVNKVKHLLKVEELA